MDNDAFRGDGMAVLLMDLRNAFNSVSRQSVLEALYVYAPQLIMWFAWSYGVPVSYDMENTLSYRRTVFNKAIH